MNENIKNFSRESISMISSISVHLLLLLLPTTSHIVANKIDILEINPTEILQQNKEGGDNQNSDDNENEEIDLIIDLNSFKQKKIVKKINHPVYVPRNKRVNNRNNIKIDQRGIYKGSSRGTGSVGTGKGGATLNIPGWTWDSQPIVKDHSNEVGKITFEFKIDDLGYVISIKTLEKTVSSYVEKLYRDAVLNLTFKKIDNVQPQEETIGRITFILKYSE